MNIIDSIINLYGVLYNRRMIPVRFLSPLRLVTRILANFIIPRMLGLNCVKVVSLNENKGKKIIVSLTSFPGRINTVWMVVECMLRQTIRPDAIILWLSKDQFKSIDEIPLSLKKRQNSIFKIRLVEKDYRSHKKYLYAFQEYPNDIVITVDDDIYYPSTMIASLVECYKKDGDAVVCRYGAKVSYNENGDILPYASWKESFDCRKNDFFGSGGGTLFQPRKLYKDVTNIELAMRLCPLADDVWLNAMTRLAGLSVMHITRRLILPVFSDTEETLCSVNVGENKNDEQIKNVIAYYDGELGVNPFSRNEI